MATFVTEAFTAADDTDLAALPGITRHPAYAGSGVVSSNRARSVTTPVAYYFAGIPASADYDVEGVIHAKTQQGQASVAGRMDPVADTYYDAFYIPFTAQWQIRRWMAGALTVLGSFTQTLANFTSYAVKLEMRGSTLRLYVDGVERIAVTDTGITAAGRAGFRLSGTAGSATTTLHLDSVTAADAAGPVDGPVLDLSWDLPASADGEALDLAWDTRAEVAAQTRAIWDVVAEVGQSIALAWDLRGQVDATVLDLVWDLEALAAAVNGPPLRAVWDLAAEVAAGRTLRWDLRTPVAAQTRLIWDLAAAIEPRLEIPVAPGLWSPRTPILTTPDEPRLS